MWGIASFIGKQHSRICLFCYPPSIGGLTDLMCKSSSCYWGRTADELERLVPPYARDTIVANSAAGTKLIMDQGALRDKICAAKE